MCGNMHAIFAAILWRRRFTAMDYHKQWNMGAPLWTCKRQSKHAVEKYVTMLVWDFNGPILKHNQDQWQAINITLYCAMLEKDLKPAVCSKHRGMLTNGAVFIMTMLDLIWKQQLFKWFKNWNSSFSPHPAYGPDLAPTDNHIFGSI